MSAAQVAFAGPLHCAVPGCGISELDAELVFYDSRWLCAAHLLEVASPAPLTTSADLSADVEPAASESPQPPVPQREAVAVPVAGADAVFRTGSVGKAGEAELDVYLRQHAAGELSPLMTPF